MKKTLSVDLSLAALFLIMHITMFRHLDIWGLQANIILLFVLWLCTVRQRTYALCVTAGTALVMDILADTWGVQLFSKTLIVMLAHRLISQQAENKLRAGQAFMLIFSVAVAYNLVFLVMSAFAGIYDTDLLFFKYLIGNSAYTAVAGLILYLLTSE